MVGNESLILSVSRLFIYFSLSYLSLPQIHEERVLACGAYPSSSHFSLPHSLSLFLVPSGRRLLYNIARFSQRASNEFWGHDVWFMLFNHTF